MMREGRFGRADFARFVPMPTRWDDNDQFGHINNVRYYAFFDTAITRLEIEAGLYHDASSAIIPYVAGSNCTYFSGLAFPDALEVGIAVTRIGATSLTYRLGVFKAGAAEVAAQGQFVHVYVDAASQRPVPLTPPIRAFAQALEIG